MKKQKEMKKRPKTRLQDARRAYEDMFGEGLYCDNADNSSSKEEELAAYDEAIAIYQMLLQNELSSHHQRPDEISLLKAEIQEAKNEKRRLLAS